MKSQVKNASHSPILSDQKKSVFERLGNLSESNRLYPSEHMPHGMHQTPPQISMRHRGDIQPQAHHNQPDMEWHHYVHQHPERRHPSFTNRDQHLLPPPPMQLSYEDGRAYYDSHYRHSTPVHGLPPPPLPQVHIDNPSQRSSPKYDRHGNLIVGFRERQPRNLVEQHFSSPDPYCVPSPRIDSIRPVPGMAPPPPRWHENIGISFQGQLAYDVQVDGYSPAAGGKFFPSFQQQVLSSSGSEVSSYARWRERRHTITTLDRETARSSSRTKSLKSSLKQNEGKNLEGRNLKSTVSQRATQLTDETKPIISQPKLKEKDIKKEPGIEPSTKETPADISDGEIVDDSSEDETEPGIEQQASFDPNTQSSKTYKRDVRIFESKNLFEHGRKRLRRFDGIDNGAMDFENISDEEFDDFVYDKNKNTSSEVRNSGNSLNSADISVNSKSASEIELLNSIGLDWANLVEMAKKSKSKDIVPSAGSARLRFTLAAYLPTLCISPELAGPELYDMVAKLSRS